MGNMFYLVFRAIAWTFGLLFLLAMVLAYSAWFVVIFVLGGLIVAAVEIAGRIRRKVVPEPDDLPVVPAERKPGRYPGF